MLPINKLSNCYYLPANWKLDFVCLLTTSLHKFIINSPETEKNEKLKLAKMKDIYIIMLIGYII